MNDFTQAVLTKYILQYLVGIKKYYLNVLFYLHLTNYWRGKVGIIQHKLKIMKIITPITDVCNVKAPK